MRMAVALTVCAFINLSIRDSPAAIRIMDSAREAGCRKTSNIFLKVESNLEDLNLLQQTAAWSLSTSEHPNIPVISI